ncbi:MAG: nucleotidyltransferase domain-containing protein [Clostridia bacterium]|nr:nucleotidyltransferase domain-containing protein [Clostridia bacterium]
MCTQNQAIGILSEVHHACNRIFNQKIADAFLYGSYARGDYHAESDVDILLTIDMDAEELVQYRNAVASVASKLSLKHDITVSVTVKPLEQFQRFANVLPYYKNILGEGIRYAV